MLKKFLMTSFVFVSALSLVHANPAPYVGASLGIVTNTSPDAFTSLTTSGGYPVRSPSNFRGVPFSAFLGYGGMLYQNFYLAGELAATIGTATISESGSLKTSYGFGASILPGVYLSDHTMAYARLGVVNSRFTTLQKNVTGGQAGLGMQTSLTQNVDVRGEYDFTAYPSITGPTGQVDAPRSDAYTLGIIYKFD
ncbi:MAG: hypothetical protein H0W64_06810 [Gammaproteobacteria bacterium]|nr:hypothetical protein [Gammaproteobacteria bacterium]